MNFLKLKFTFTKAEDKKFNCKQVLFERRADCCKLNKGTLNQMFLGRVLSTIREKINFDLSCPYKMGYKTITNLTATPNGSKFPISFYGFFCITIKAEGQVMGSKQSENLCEFSLNVKIY